jgi:outer membrane receptor protein involved in Fe transport
MVHKIPFLSVDAQDNVLMKGNASFKVLINGKESGMFANNLSQILRTMPASSVLRIEVITIPPSKYDADGLTGIINIVTNRKIAGGYKGSLNVNEGFPKGGPGIGGSITAQVGKLGINAFAGAGIDNRLQTSFFNNRTTTGTNPVVLQQNGNTRLDAKNVYTGMELSYEIDSLNLVTGNLNISGNRQNGVINQVSSLTGPGNTVQQAYYLNNVNRGNGGGFDAALNYQLGFRADKNSLLTFSYRYSDYGSNTSTHIDISNPVHYPVPDYKQPNNADTKEQTAQIDYVHPIHKVNMEAGVKAIFRNSNSNSQYLSLDSANNIFEADPALSNQFNYIQDVFSAYNSYQFSLKKWNFSAGLRAEETYVNAKFISTNTSAVQNYFNVVPSIAINHSFANNSSLNLGFAQRIQRPGIDRLNPFVDRSNPDYIIVGNPGLRPVLMNNMELGYSNGGGKKVSVYVAAGYTFFNNLELTVTNFDPASQITTTTYEDNAKGGGVGFNYHLSYAAGKLYSLTLNGYVMQFFVNGTEDIASSKTNILAGHVSLSNGFKFDGGWSANVNGDYNSHAPRSIQGVSNAYFTSSLSLNKELVKNKLFVSGAINNPFTKFRNDVTRITGPGFEETNSNQLYFRSVRFTLNYNFGHLASDIKKSRKTINNDDKGAAF